MQRALGSIVIRVHHKMLSRNKGDIGEGHSSAVAEKLLSEADASQGNGLGAAITEFDPIRSAIAFISQTGSIVGDYFRKLERRRKSADGERIESDRRAGCGKGWISWSCHDQFADVHAFEVEFDLGACR